MDPRITQGVPGSAGEDDRVGSRGSEWSRAWCLAEMPISGLVWGGRGLWVTDPRWLKDGHFSASKVDMPKRSHGG